MDSCLRMQAVPQLKPQHFPDPGPEPMDRPALREPGDSERDNRDRLKCEEQGPVCVDRGWQQVRQSRKNHAGQDRDATGTTIDWPSTV